MAQVRLPHTFVDGPGNTASGEQVMANFNAVLGAVNAGIDVENLTSALHNMLFKAGDLKLSAKPTADQGWLDCDGSAVSRATYSALFGAIGTTYGAGDGSSTFNVPDYRGRQMVPKGPHADVNTLGRNDGNAVATRTPSHLHAMSSHTHPIPHRHDLPWPVGRVHGAVLGPAAVTIDPLAASTSGSLVPAGTVSMLRALPYDSSTDQVDLYVGITSLPEAGGENSAAGGGGVETSSNAEPYQVINVWIRT